MQRETKTRFRLPSPGEAMFIFMSAFSLLLILRNSDAAIKYIGSGLVLCARTVIPSLFPFMVISELVVSSGLSELAGKYLNRPLGFIFGISGVSSSAVLLGALCGFPIGSRTAVALFDNGLIDKKETARLLSFCNNPSSAFLISAVGTSLYARREVGVMLYSVTLINALIIGIAQRIFTPRRRANMNHISKNSPSGISAFTNSVTRSAEAMLIICAYVIFFSAIIGCLSDLLLTLNCSGAVMAFIYGSLEISGGVAAASSLGLTRSGLTLAAFIVGWSGLSVHFQIISVTAKRGLPLRPYFIAKLIQGLMNALSVYIILTFFPSLLDASVPAASAAAASPLYFRYAAAVTISFAAALPAALRKGAQNRHI